jgi:glycosyltransferase involved in cell wall biosynthesis
MNPPPGPVALLFHEGQTGGASLTVVRVLDELSERGWQFCAYVDSPGPLADLLEAHGVDVDGRRRMVGFSRRWLRHPPGPAAKLRSMPPWFAGLAVWLRRTNPALVHANSLYSLPDALVARACGIPTFLKVLEMLPDGRKGAAARRVCATAGIRVGTVSMAAARRYAGDGPLPDLVRTGVPMPDALAQRPEHPEHPLVGTIGMVGERKGTDLFLDAAQEIRRSRPDVRFRIVGDVLDGPGVEWGRAQLALARELGIEHVVGADGLAQLREFDVFVLPSRFDPYPLVVMEAMASGVPVVATAVDGIVEQVVPGTGLLARPEDATDLAKNVLTLLGDDAARAAAGRAARAHAQRTFRLSDQADAMEAAWLRTLDVPCTTPTTG